MKKFSLPAIIYPAAFCTGTLLFFCSACTAKNAEPPPPLIREGENYGSVDNGVFNSSICKWQLPDNGNGCKLITESEFDEKQITLLNGPAGTTETLIITPIAPGMTADGGESDKLLYSIAAKELAGLRAQNPDMNTGEVEKFESTGADGYYFGCRADRVEMGLAVFMRRNPDYLCSYSFSRLLPARRKGNWENLQQMTVKGLDAIRFHDLSNTIFGMPR